ncbi:methyl-accepting chemotaxis protein [Haloarcula pelagica]|nr:methyl-accepting chemotaxis protein [Halomicroarcula sp. YJ-61-S]
MSQTDNDGGSTGLLPTVIRRRFVRKYVALVVVAMVVTAGVGAFFATSATGTLDRQVQQQTASTAQLQADGLEGWVDGLRHQTRTVSEAAPFQRGDRDEVGSYLLNRLQNARSDIVAIHYVKISNATVMASTTPGTEGTNLRARGVPWATRSGDIDNETDTISNVVVGDTPYESSTNETVVAFISAPPRNTEHVVVVEAALSVRGGFHQTTDGAFTTVHNGFGSLVYGQAHDDVTVPEQALGSDTAGFRQRSDSVLGYAPVEGTDWTVVTHVPKANAYALRDQLATTIAGLILVPLLVLGSATLLFGRRTSTALTELTEKAERMRAGDLDITLRRTRADEIGRLTGAFDEMRSSLKAQIDEAEQARKKAEVSRAEAVAMNDYLQERADEYSETLARCAEGDLTVRLEQNGENDAMDRIAGGFNEMINELEKTTGQLTRFADEVAETGKTVEASAHSLQDASEQIAESIQTVSIDANRQQEQLQAISEEIDDVAQRLEAESERHDELAFEAPLESLREVATTVSEVSSVSEQTTAEAETVAGAAEEQAAELTEVTQQADTLRRYAVPLGDVLSRFKTGDDREFYFPSGPGNRESPATED